MKIPHEPLIDRETWDIVQKVRQGKRRPNKMGEQDMLSGLVECEACGTKHYLCCCGSWNEEQYTYTCGRYHKHKDECTPHTIKVTALHQIVLVEIQRVTAEAKEHTEQFLQRAMDKHQSQLKRELSVKARELEKAQKRLADLDKLFRKAFGQLALENLSETQFKELTSGYEAEKQELLILSGKLEQEISTGKDTMLNADRFMAVVDRYTDIQKLTPEIVQEFIEKIVVYERSERWKKKNYTQQVDVYFNFVGKSQKLKTSLLPGGHLPVPVFCIFILKMVVPHSERMGERDTPEGLPYTESVQSKKLSEIFLSSSRTYFFLPTFTGAARTK